MTTKKLLDLLNTAKVASWDERRLLAEIILKLETLELKLDSIRNKSNETETHS